MWVIAMHQGLAWKHGDMKTRVRMTGTSKQCTDHFVPRSVVDSGGCCAAALLLGRQLSGAAQASHQLRAKVCLAPGAGALHLYAKIMKTGLWQVAANLRTAHATR